MPFRDTSRKYEKDVPGTYQGPPKCSREIDGERCGKPAAHTLSMTIAIMDKQVPVKKPICADCLEELNK